MKVYESIIPNISDWPAHRLSEDRKQFIEEINNYTFEKLTKQHPQKLADLLAQTIFMERARVKNTPWKVDPPNDAQFWSRINRKLVREIDAKDEKAIENNEALLKKIIHHYAEEIVGTFKISTFLFARKFLTVFFGRLLNAASAQGFFKSVKRLIFGGGELSLYDRFKVHGEIDHIRNLATKGTLVVVPTHFSNLDSILVGYVMDAKLGLPSFSYGAGLNLYNSGAVAYFLNRLGAYRVDRRKKNSIYLETLKGMSNLSLQRGTNTLFFPGGTRSRSGSLETKLKMGLLGTVIEAQRSSCQKETGNKIFIVPLVMSYHFVLEGQSLIEQQLRTEGKERYTKTSKDEFYSFRKITQYIWNFFSEESEITLSFGKPIDIMGNFVDFHGESIDKFGNALDIKEYFMLAEKVTADTQRENEYTHLLAEKITERYFKENVVLSSHLIAFTAFKMLQNKYNKLDIYGLLRLPSDDIIFPMTAFKAAVEQLKHILIRWEHQGKLKCSEQIHWSTEKLIQHGVSELGIYHFTKPLVFNKNKDLISSNFSLLYFYHNRLENYGLDKLLHWSTYDLSLAMEEIAH
ncbi:MAG: 1-acyl-sn-glycerol-3-phosphate acyltransferase [Saprospiraceae bacterium]